MSATAVSDAPAGLAALGGRVSTVAHELRNLLGPIDLYASLLAEECAPSPELARLSGRLLAGVRALGAVTANLLAVGRRTGIERLPVDLGRLVQEVVEGGALSVRGTGIAVRSRLLARDALVAGDAVRLRQALLNLLLNGLEAMPDGGALTVTVTARGGLVAVIVRDTGAGMDRATLARATDAFFTTRPHGTGLGLAVVREVADLHGARLVIASRPGAGTAVRLTFPLLTAGTDRPATAGRRPTGRRLP